MIATDLVGYAATVIGTSMMLPQVKKLLATKRAADLSVGMALLYVGNCILWGSYGWLIAARPVMAANGIGLIIAVLQTVLIFKYRHND